MASTKYINISGFNLEYRFIGPPPGERPTLVFLHEGLGCVSLWRDFPDKLAMRIGLGALIYSRAGYGKSDPVPLPRPVTFMHDEADVLKNLLEQLNIRNAVLFGHSDGASISLIYSGMYRCRNVRAIIVEGPHVFTEQICFDQVERMRDLFTTTDLRSKMERHHGTNTDVAFSGWNGAWSSPEFRTWNIEEYLSSINVPLLMIQGHDDEYGTMLQLETIARQVHGPVEMLKLDKCGHWPHRDFPERTLETADCFIARHLSASDPLPV